MATCTSEGRTRREPDRVLLGEDVDPFQHLADERRRMAGHVAGLMGYAADQLAGGDCGGLAFEDIAELARASQALTPTGWEIFAPPIEEEPDDAPPS